MEIDFLKTRQNREEVNLIKTRNSTKYLAIKKLSDENKTYSISALCEFFGIARRSRSIFCIWCRKSWRMALAVDAMLFGHGKLSLQVLYILSDQFHLHFGVQVLDHAKYNPQYCTINHHCCDKQDRLFGGMTIMHEKVDKRCEHC